MAKTTTALRSAGHLEIVHPELQPTEVTKVKNIPYCSSMLNEPGLHAGKQVVS